MGGSQKSLGGSELERVSNKILKRGGGMVSQDTQEARRNGEGVNSSNSLSDILVHKVSQYPINKKRKTEAEVKESSKEVQGEGAGDGGQGGKDDAEVRSSTRHNLKQRSSQNTALLRMIKRNYEH